MSKSVNKTEFWKERLRAENIRDSVYVTTPDDWQVIDFEHSQILKPYKDSKVLDAGCGYGRWSEFFSDYTGVDFSPDFIDKAKELYPCKNFLQAQMKKLPFKNNEFDMAFCVSVKQMIVANLGQEEWDLMEKELKRVAKTVILLEYSHPKEHEQINTQ